MSRGVKIHSQTISKPAKIEKMKNIEKEPKTAGFIHFSMFKMHFRSADAANHLKCVRGPASALNDLLRQQKGKNFWFFIVISYIDSMPEDYSIIWEYICSTSLPGGNQVDGLPPASSNTVAGSS